MAELKRAARKRNGSHVSSGIDADEWRQFLASYRSSLIDLCITVSKHAIRIATEELHLFYKACRLIALHKCPGVRPIVFGEDFRRIIVKIIVQCVKSNPIYLGKTYRGALDKGGASNMLSIHFVDDGTERIILLDALILN